MWPILREGRPIQQASTGFKDALRYGSFILDARLTVYQDGQATQYIVPLSSASVTMDRNSSNRFTSNITVELLPTVPPPAEMPTSMSAPLAPYNEVFIETSIQTDPASREWVPMGLFVIDTATVQDSTIDVTVTLTLKDRSWLISQRKFTAPYNIPAAGGNFVDEIEHLINQVWNQGTSPALTFNITPTDATVPSASYNEGSDPWKAALDMATAVGYELFFDRNGIVTGYPIPDPSTQPVVWHFAEDDVTVEGTLNHPVGGTPYTTPVATTVTFTGQAIYNTIIVSGTGSQNATGSASGSSAPVRAEAQDTTPSSPTYIGGRMGVIPEFKQTSLATTKAVAQAMANNELQAVLADAHTISVTTPPNPLLDIDDVCDVTRARLGLNATKFVIDQIQFDLKYDATTIVTGRAVVT